MMMMMMEEGGREGGREVGRDDVSIRFCFVKVAPS